MLNERYLVKLLLFFIFLIECIGFLIESHGSRDEKVLSVAKLNEKVLSVAKLNEVVPGGSKNSLEIKKGGNYQK